MTLIFYMFSFLSIISTFFTVVQKNAVYSLFYLIISLLSISGIFFSFGAFFAGALEVIIYAGAIIVLFVFIVMMLNLDDEYNIQKEKYLKPIFWIKPSLLSFIMFCLTAYTISSLKELKINYFLIDSKIIGMNLFNQYALLVELSSMLLLSALVVVFHIGTEKKDINKNQELFFNNIHKDDDV